MNSRPFKTNGIYVRLADKEKEFPDEKSSKLKSIWNIASGGAKEENLYEVAWFVEVKELNKYWGHSKEKFSDKFRLHLCYVEGELLTIVDKYSGYDSNIKSEFYDFKFNENGFSCKNDVVTLNGWTYDDILDIRAKVNATNKLQGGTFRFIRRM